jgi:copper chaperone CopZ
MNKEVLRFPQGSGAAVTAPEAHVIRDWQLMHHIPGRLRVRAATLRRNRDRAGEIEGIVKAIDGVSAAAVNLLTGSLTVVYEPSRVSANAILDTLRCRGLAALQRGKQEVKATRSDTPAGRMGRAVLYLVLEHIVERSVKAGFAALL